MLTDAVCRFGADRAEKFAVTEVDNADRTKETSDLYDIEVRLSDFPCAFSSYPLSKHYPISHYTLFPFSGDTLDLSSPPPPRAGQVSTFPVAASNTVP